MLSVERHSVMQLNTPKRESAELHGKLSTKDEAITYFCKIKSVSSSINSSERGMRTNSALYLDCNSKKVTILFAI